MASLLPFLLHLLIVQSKLARHLTYLKVQVAEQQTSSQLQNATDNVNKVLKQSNKSLEFSVDTGTKKSIVKLIDTDTGDLIRQYPTEEMLAISNAIDQFQQGGLLKQKA